MAAPARNLPNRSLVAPVRSGKTQTGNEVSGPRDLRPPSCFLVAHSFGSIERQIAGFQKVACDVCFRRTSRP